MNAATVISKIYQAYAVKLAKAGTRLDIDVPDPLVKIEKPGKITKVAESYLDYCLKNPAKANVTLSISRGRFYIKDDTRLMKPEDRAVLETVATTTHQNLAIKVRLGFGTTISLPL